MKARPTKTLWIPNATVFISSFCIMVLELVASRLIARFLGSSLYTWTAVIGVVLAGITVGNFLGGRIADKSTSRKSLAVLFILASVSCLATIVANHLTGQWEFLWYFSWQARTFLHVGIVFFLPSLLLGTISPVVAKMALDYGLPPGRTVGNIYAWGAAGSIAGTFACGYYLIAVLGTTQIVLAVALVLLVMALLYYWRLGGAYLWMGLFLLALAITYGPWGFARTIGIALGLRPPAAPEILYDKEGRYCHIQVKRKQTNPEIRSFIQDKLDHSIINMDDPSDLQYFYIRIYGALTSHIARNKPVLSTLTIGGGGYVFPRYIEQHWPGSRVDVAEIDPDVTRAAREAFGLAPETTIRTITLDGRNYIDELDHRRRKGEEAPVYDIIYEDAINHFNVPFQLTTRQFNQKIYDSLAPDGVYLVNIIDLYESGKFLGALIQTLEQTFPCLEVLAREQDKQLLWARTTFVLVAAKKPLPVKQWLAEYLMDLPLWFLDAGQRERLKRRANYLILTDNYAPVEQLLAPVARESGTNDLAERFLGQARTLCQRGLYEQSIAQYQNLLYANPSTAVMVNNDIAVIRTRQNQLPQAVECFRQALQYNEQADGIYDMTLVHLNLGNTLRRLGRSAEAKRHLDAARRGLQQALRNNPYSFSTLVMCAELAVQDGNPPAAIDYYERALRLQPLYGLGVLELGRLYHRQGQGDRALRIVQAILENPNARLSPELKSELTTLLEQLRRENTAPARLPDESET
ncbi:MAG: fused MFS/spermidine synthase [Sedimentisphaerales bacterium]|nr:fused MFS/spermidine synthase [Sedimentisphaerales bacterium]